MIKNLITARDDASKAVAEYIDKSEFWRKINENIKHFANGEPQFIDYGNPYVTGSNVYFTLLYSMEVYDETERRTLTVPLRLFDYFTEEDFNQWMKKQ